MTDQESKEEATVIAEAGDEGPVPSEKKRRPSGRRGTSPRPARQTAIKARPGASPARPRRYSDSEKSAKLAEVENSVAGGTTVKAAVKDAGISMQTYYQWKHRTAAPVQRAAKPAPDGMAIGDLVELDAENQRLRKLLAEKLRAENAELRKRLGIA